MATISVSEARANLKAVLDRVRAGESVSLTRNDEVVAVVVHPSRLARTRQTPLMDAAESRLAALTDPARRRSRRELGVRKANELAAAVRAERDRG